VEGANRAKQSQFLPGRISQHSTIISFQDSKSSAAAPGWIAQNEANFLLAGRSKRGERGWEGGRRGGNSDKTKPISDGEDIPAFHYSIIPGFQGPGTAPGGIAPNKANSGARPIVRNEANLRQGRVGRAGGALGDNPAFSSLGHGPVQVFWMLGKTGVAGNTWVR